MSEIELKNFWEEYVNSKFLYRMVSEEYIPQIKKNGFNHHQDPFEEVKPLLFKLFDILMDLKKKGFIMMRLWDKPVDQEIVINCSKRDLNINYIDFTPNQGNIINYYLDLEGGALVQTILIFTTEILTRKPQLKDEEIELIKILNDWAKKKSNYKNRVISIRASSKYFENAEFQILDGKNYRNYKESPFGSFEHFKSVIEKNGIDRYLPFLENKNMFYLRTTEVIPSSEIFKIGGKA